MSILEQVQVIFRDIFDDENLVITGETSAKDIEDWDSLTHIQLVTKIEKHFKIRFTLSEITKLKQVSDLILLIQTKQT
ncbi:MAG: acyl carrier protein [Erysipelotrichaceae bacterium]|nr:MAG: acyl carrier [Erysipelotrichaceae bacterium]TXT17758.1 MAG: acyl carrier protein [Erysipelotrichaceae bacterium]